ncbi:T9SS type A sorting domain-containing protein [Polaribacter sp.]|uniref:T9SS type A sorting domain-containing protein n=1 Tax=Polaribacter sp. TaxID=1920175 RepID=UPI003EF67A69
MKKYIITQLLIVMTLVCHGQTPTEHILGLNADDRERVVDLNDTGTIIAIGSPNFSNNKGRVRVLEKIGGSWVAKGSILLGSGSSSANQMIFGISVAISNDGNHLAVGASAFQQGTSNRGRLYLYEFVNNDWVLRFTDTGSSNGRLGISLDMNGLGDVVIAGAPTSTQGWGPEAKFYTRSGSTWTLRALRNLANNSAFGYAVSCNSAGDMFAVGAPDYNGTTGLVRLFSFNKSTGATAILQTINGSVSGGRFGRHVNFSGDGSTLIVGAPLENANGFNNAGATYIYENSGSSFSLVHNIKGENAEDQLGFNTATNDDGSLIAISAQGRDVGCGADYGSFYSLTRKPSGYQQNGLPVIGAAPENYAGLGMSMNATGSILAVSERDDDTNGNNAGKIQFYNNTISSPEITYYSAAVKTHLLSNSLLNTNGDGIIEENEAKNFTGTLNLDNLGLTDLKVLINFPLITGLEASNNNFSSINLSTKIALSSVRIENNPALASIVFPASCIENVYLSGNNFQNIDFSTYTNLVAVDLSQNNLNALDLRNGNNPQIDANIFDITGNPNLVCVFVDNATTSTQNWTQKDAQMHYVTTQQQCTNLTSTTWLGTTNNEWHLSANWSNGIPTASLNAIIPIPFYPTMSSQLFITKDLEIQSGGLLSILPEQKLTIEGNLTQSGTLTINSDASASGSCIVKGSAIGDITYNRYVTSIWHIISSMVTDQSLNDFVTNAANKITNYIPAGSTDTKYALGTYAQGANSWIYYSSSDIVAAGDFGEAIGYSLKRDVAGTVAFTGKYRDVDVSATVTPATGTSLGYRSLGNPYSSFMDLNVAGTNFLTLNDSALLPGHKVVYIYNFDGTGVYVGVSDLSLDTYLVPGQGFLIRTDANGGTISIPESLQSHQTGGALSRNSSKITRIEMSITDGTLTRKSNVYFHESGAKGMDNNDAIVFTDYDLNLYSNLVDGSYATEDFYTQTLPTLGNENMTIPLGVNAPTNTEITFNFNHKDLPEGYMLYLEDRELNTFTQVDNGVNYTTICSANGVGRFYLHTTKAVLTTDVTSLTKVLIYSVKNSIQVKGISLGETNITVYDLLGRVILKDRFTDKNMYEISTIKFTKGSIYSVDLETSKGKITKKVIIQ